MQHVMKCYWNIYIYIHRWEQINVALGIIRTLKNISIWTHRKRFEYKLGSRHRAAPHGDHVFLNAGKIKHIIWNITKINTSQENIESECAQNTRHTAHLQVHKHQNTRKTYICNGKHKAHSLAWLDVWRFCWQAKHGSANRQSWRDLTPLLVYPLIFPKQGLYRPFKGL